MAAPASTQTPKPRRRRLTLALGALAVLVLAAAGAFAVLGAKDGKQAAEATQPLVPRTRAEGAGFNPLAYSPARNPAFERRAAAGFAHPLYAKPLGGAAATAARVERFGPQINAAASEGGVDADTLAALVYLESAGQPDAMAGPDPRSAAGLTQILPETAQNLLGMHVDLAQSVALTKRLAKAQRKAQPALAGRLEAQRRRVDDRFDPVKALHGTAVYLRKSRAQFSREDLAVEAYHMGIGNLQQALAAYGATDIPYAQLYFDSSPSRHAAAYRKLFSLGDDSSTYWFRILAAKEIVRLARANPSELTRRATLQTQKNSAENLLHPPGSGAAFAAPADVARAEGSGELLRLNARKLAHAGLRIDPRMGELAPQLNQRPSRYRALRPQALATLGYIAAGVHGFTGGRAKLTVTSTVRDGNYQRLLVGRNIEATPNFSLHTTGYAFDISRKYTSPKQAYAFQFFLNRLQALNLIAWVREPTAIHVTVAREAASLNPALDRLGLR